MISQRVLLILGDTVRSTMLTNIRMHLITTLILGDTVRTIMLTIYHIFIDMQVSQTLTIQSECYGHNVNEYMRKLWSRLY